MQLKAFFAPLALLAPLARAAIATYDPSFDLPNSSLNTVACSDGENGLESRGYTTFKSIPNFPYIGGASVIGGYNSPNCGTCHQLTYINAAGNKTSVYITLIDTSGGQSQYNIAKGALDTLTHGQAEHLGKVNVTSIQVSKRNCGLS